MRNADGEVLGAVRDLLADPDRLIAEFLIVEHAQTPAGSSIVPLGSLERRGSHLIPGVGLEPIRLRYQSTVHLTLWTASAAIVLLLAWLLWSLMR